MRREYSALWKRKRVGRVRDDDEEYLESELEGGDPDSWAKAERFKSVVLRRSYWSLEPREVERLHALEEVRSFSSSESKYVKF